MENFREIDDDTSIDILRNENGVEDFKISWIIIRSFQFPLPKILENENMSMKIFILNFNGQKLFEISNFKNPLFYLYQKRDYNKIQQFQLNIVSKHA